MSLRLIHSESHCKIIIALSLSFDIVNSAVCSDGKNSRVSNVKFTLEGSRPLQVHIRGHDYFAHGSTFTKPYKGSEQHNGVTGLQTSHKSDLNPMYRLQGEVPLSLGILTLIEYSVTLVKICHLAKWHLHLSRHLAKVRQRYKQTTDRIRTTITRPTQLAKNGNLKTNITSIVPLPNDISVHSHVS